MFSFGSLRLDFKFCSSSNMFMFICFFVLFVLLRPSSWVVLFQTVYDHDTFSKDDKMGDAEFSISAYVEALKMHVVDVPNGTILTKVQPCRANCLSEETSIIWNDGKVTQDLCLRLRNVESGEVEIQLQWIELPGSKGL